MTFRVFCKRFFLILFLSGILVLFLPQLVISQAAKGRILSLENIPAKPFALVLGASVVGDLPSPVLAHRIETAVELYRNGKVKKLIMSGDNTADDYTEVLVMKKAALELGIPEKDILLDGAGIRTYDSCERASKEFGVREAIVVTQEFHLPRALYLCRKFGIDAYGYKADKAIYRDEQRNRMREFVARIQAFFEVNFFPETARKLGEKFEF